MGHEGVGDGLGALRKAGVKDVGKENDCGQCLKGRRKKYSYSLMGELRIAIRVV